MHILAIIGSIDHDRKYRDLILSRSAIAGSSIVASPGVARREPNGPSFLLKTSPYETTNADAARDMGETLTAVERRGCGGDPVEFELGR